MNPFILSLWIPGKRRDLINHINDPLFKNSYYLIINHLLAAGSGFLFWILAARFYTTDEVGLGAALISTMGFLSIFSLLGFDIGLIRYLPEEKDKNGMINSCFTIASVVALMMSLIFILGLNIWSPALIVLGEDQILGSSFILFTIGTTFFLFQTHVFVAFRQVKYSSTQALVSTAMRIVLLPLLVFLGAFGIYISAGLATLIAVLIGNMLIWKVFSEYKPIPVIKWRMIKDMLRYSLGNHIANILYFLPGSVLPLLVVKVLGGENNAYFYVAWATASLLQMIPLAVSKSLLAESSYLPEELRRNVLRSLKFVFILLIPAIIGIFIFGKYILLLFGEMYATNAFDVLLWLSIASAPHAVIVIYVSIKRVKHEVMPIIYLYGGVTAITLIVSYISIEKMGLTGIGISWFIGNVIAAVLIGINLWVQRLRSPLQK